MFVTVVGGITKVVILIAYMALIGLMPDIRRTFQYHGAEHKTVYCNENDLPLTPENAQQFTTLHPRCGTAFMLIVMVISMVLFLFVGRDISAFLPRFLLHLALLPVVAGVSYEVLKGLAHSKGKIVEWLRWPGMQMQRLTTKEPTADMLEVAIVSMNVALYGLPKGCETTPEGYTVIRDYRVTDPSYVPEDGGEDAGDAAAPVSDERNEVAEAAEVAESLKEKAEAVKEEVRAEMHSEAAEQ
ncbi:MAG: DUF1385 domain-containing protein [Clostridia bacterium]|nr:DUF1385 domain-containing protein [Clostridia bacterium]